MSCDKNRKLVYDLLKASGITIGTDKYINFSTFLHDPANSNYLQLFFILCSGYYSYEEAFHKIVDMLKELDFQQNSYSYSQLFKIDPAWYEYYQENAYPTGQRKISNDVRRGVDKRYIDDITIIRKRLKLPLDESIHWLTRLRIKLYC